MPARRRVRHRLDHGRFRRGAHGRRLLEETRRSREGARRLANWFARCPGLARGAPPPIAQQPLKRRLRYFIRDMRSALGASGRAYR
jgi:hypothetical protein